MAAPSKKPASGFAALRSDPALRKCFDKAKTTPPGGLAYEGDDADLVCRLAQNKVAKHKDGHYYAVLEFRVLGGYPGQSDIEGQKCVCFFSFNDNNRGTKEENLAYYFEALGSCGVDCTQDDDAIEAAAAELIVNQSPIMVTAKWKGDYLNFFVKEALEGEAAADPADEEADNAPADEEADTTSGTVVASEWDGFVAYYTEDGVRTQYWIDSPNDEDNSVKLIDENSEVVYDWVSIEDENLEIEQ
jgi:hypothetical protein